MALVNGSDEYYEYKKHAEKLYRKAANASSITERRKIAQKAEEFGVGDKEVKYIIEQYYLRRLD